MIAKNLVVKIQNLVVNHESRPIKSNLNVEGYVKQLKYLCELKM